MKLKRPQFSRIGFILTAVGAAVGLGNIWKFPYIAYDNDGGSFVIVYLLAVAIIGLPLMLGEVIIGRSTKLSPALAFKKLAHTKLGKRLWPWVGALGVTAVFSLGIFYFIIAGWTISYFFQCLKWSSQGFDLTAPELGQNFGGFLHDWKKLLFFTFIYLAINMTVVLGGLKKGIERLNKIAMPLLAIALLVMLVAAIPTPGFKESLKFMFHLGPISAEGVLEAVGHSFFTLSLGMGALITFGSYLPEKVSITKSSIVIVLMDTAVAIVAALIMFSIIFTVPEAERASSFSDSGAILFTTLPRLLYNMPLGNFIAPMFYLLLGVAAVSSTIGGTEVVIRHFMDRFKWSRTGSAIAFASLTFAGNILAALSLGGHKGLSEWDPLNGRVHGFFDFTDYLVSNWMLPVGGLLTTIFIGWVISKEVRKETLRPSHRFIYQVWEIILKLVIPIALICIVIAVITGKRF